MSSERDVKIDCSYNTEYPSGKIYVDTSKGPLTVFLMNLLQTTPAGESLEIIKVSDDNHPIALYARECKVGDKYDIYTFGHKGKASRKLFFDGERWKHL